eukprot:646744-Pyramimonas_sp.AAC.1
MLARNVLLHLRHRAGRASAAALRRAARRARQQPRQGCAMVRPCATPSTVEEPLTPNREPLTSTMEPLTSNVEPLTSNMEPLTSNMEPLTSTVEPLTSTVEPLTLAVEIIWNRSIRVIVVKGGACFTFQTSFTDSSGV